MSKISVKNVQKKSKLISFTCILTFVFLSLWTKWHTNKTCVQATDTEKRIVYVQFFPWKKRWDTVWERGGTKTLVQQWKWSRKSETQKADLENPLFTSLLFLLLCYNMLTFHPKYLFFTLWVFLLRSFIPSGGDRSASRTRTSSSSIQRLHPQRQNQRRASRSELQSRIRRAAPGSGQQGAKQLWMGWD